MRRLMSTGNYESWLRRSPKLRRPRFFATTPSWKWEGCCPAAVASQFLLGRRWISSCHYFFPSVTANYAIALNLTEIYKRGNGIFNKKIDYFQVSFFHDDDNCSVVTNEAHFNWFCTISKLEKRRVTTSTKPGCSLFLCVSSRVFVQLIFQERTTIFSRQNGRNCNCRNRNFQDNLR